MGNSMIYLRGGEASLNKEPLEATTEQCKSSASENGACSKIMPSGSYIGDAEQPNPSEKGVVFATQRPTSKVVDVTLGAMDVYG
jgi:hypothetical protein